MATSLQRQLNAIAAKSTHQLDLKAQKDQHSRSLLFEPSDASRQSFDELYDLCIDGFEEICRLDSRFLPFANSLFAPSSKDIDRGQLTSSENEELDRTTLRFLGLVQGRLLLKPAQKSVEWLVRRWKIHDFNTEALLLTFLPYHTQTHIFPAVLALLSSKQVLPESLRWLHPYIAPRSCPPSHALINAAATNRPFFAAFNAYMIRAAKAGHIASTSLSFWANVLLQALSAMLDSSRSGRKGVRQQKEEEVQLKILPILRDAFSIAGKRNIDELYVAACMICVILATKASLADATLNALMQTVAASWTEPTVAAGISCLAHLADEKPDVGIPISVVSSLVKIDFAPRLSELAASQRVSKLAAGVVNAMIAQSTSSDSATLSPLLQLLEEVDCMHCITLLLDAPPHQESTDHLVRALEAFKINEIGRRALERMAQNGRSDQMLQGLLSDVPESLDVPPVESISKLVAATVPGDELCESNLHIDFESITAGLPRLHSDEFSFLDGASAGSDYFAAFSHAFSSLASSPTHLATFVKEHLHGTAALSRPVFFTFLIRVWTSGAAHITANTKVKALRLVTDKLNACTSLAQATESDSEAAKMNIDMQFMYPYVLHALGDQEVAIRKAAAQLCTSLSKLTDVTNSKPANLQIWGKDTLYTTNHTEAQISWLNTADSYRFLQGMLTPLLQDCILDARYISLALPGLLKSARKDKTMSVESYKAYVAATCDFLASHAAVSPILRTRQYLLELLAQFGSDANAARSRFLLPLLKRWATDSEEHSRNSCTEEHLDLHDMDLALLKNMWQYSTGLYQSTRAICIDSQRADLREGAFTYQSQSWNRIKLNEVRVETITWLLQLSSGETSEDEQVVYSASECLRSLDLQQDTLVEVLDGLPKMNDLREHSPAHKKQRRSLRSDQFRVPDPEKTQQLVRRITLVLEVVASSKAQRPELLRPLFNVLAELRQLKTTTGSELTYLYSLLLEILLSVVNHAQGTVSATKSVDQSIIRTDLLIECVRTSSSSQIHNTALLLISSLASWTPDSVLHSVMPLFTFMSSTVLQRADDYSAHITEQMIARIVPALATSLKTQGKDILAGVSGMLLSFVAAWEHIPWHRRLVIFRMVVEAVGVKDSLGAVCAMLAERYLSDDVAVSAFLADLVKERRAIDILQAADQWLVLLTAVSQHSPQNKRKRQPSVSEVLFGLAEKSAEEQADTLQRLTGGLQSLLQNNEIRAAVLTSLAETETDELQLVRQSYASLLEHTTELATKAEKLQIESPKSILSAVLDLLPTAEFIASSTGIMQQGSDFSRELVFASLEARVEKSKSGDPEAETLVDLIPACAAFIRPNQHTSLTAAALSCLDTLCDKYGKRNLEYVWNAAQAVAGNAGLGAEDDGLQTLSILCLASMVVVLEDSDHGLTLFSKALDTVLSNLSLTANGDIAMERATKDASFRFLTAVLDHIPWLLTSSPDKLDRALTAATGNGSISAPAVTDFLALAAKKTPIADLSTSIGRTWTQTVAHLTLQEQRSAIDLHAFGALVDLLKQAMQNNAKGAVTKHASAIFRVLLEAFDLHRQIGLEKQSVSASNFPTAVNQVALDFTLKLNDATFRPLFVQLVQWATSDLSPSDSEKRLTSLYGYALVLFERLGSLVSSSYMTYLLQPCCDILRSIAKGFAHSDVTVVVLKLLGASFRNDEDDFWAASAHFEAVNVPLLDLLRVKEKSLASGRELVIQTVSELAAAVSASQEQLKSINAVLLSLLRDDAASVRLAAVQCERSITQKVTFDWLALLPEMLPVISELQEDDDEQVERETLRWIREIEDTSGESLEGMLS